MRFKFTGIGCVPLEAYLANIAHSWSLEPKRITKWGSGPLAIVGSGPSLIGKLDKLKDYSEVWGINRIAAWLCSEGIPATLFTADPQYQATKGIERAIVASCCDPRMMRELQGKDVRVFPMGMDEGEGWAALDGATSAARVPLVALKAGFTRIDFYGCEGGFTGAGYFDGREFDPGIQEQLIIKANGKEFVTVPELVMQCESLAELMTMAPDFARNESGGLLQAMIDDPEWEMVGVSEALARQLFGVVDELEPYSEKAAAAA